MRPRIGRARGQRPVSVPGPHMQGPLCVILFLVGRRLAADGAA
jgi:hypothetical protein